MLSPDQLDMRKGGITATDIAAIIGVHPFRSALDVFLDKTGGAQPFTGNERTKWGNLLEPVIRRDYEERHNVRVELPGTLERGWQMATPDGLVYPADSLDADRGLEIKVHGRQAMFGLEYGAPGTDEVPEHELVQSMWNVDVSGLDRWDLVVFDGTPIEYVIQRDDELIAMLRERAERFLVDNVRANMPPEPDGSDQYGAWLKRRWSNTSEGMIDVRDRVDVLSDVEALRENVVAFDKIEKAIEVLQQRIKMIIGDQAGITWPNRGGKPGKITWKMASGGTETDHQGIVQDMKIAAALVLDGKRDAFEVLEAMLLRVGGTYVGNSTTSGIELLKSIREMRSTLTDIAKAVTTPNHIKTAAGSRRFLVPRSWKKA